MSRRYGNPERHLEPPEIEEPKYCFECELEDCLLSQGKVCPKDEKASRDAYNEWRAGG